MTYTELTEKLTKLFADAGFSDARLLFNESNEIPENSLVFNNSYALVVSCFIQLGKDDIVSHISKQKEEMHSVIRNVLLELETSKGLIIDGYLLIVLSEKPNKENLEAILKIEQDTKVCRKHILWPASNGEDIDRVQYVTFFNLPEPLAFASSEEGSFELSKSAQLLLQEYEHQKSLDKLLVSIKDGVLNNVN